MTYHWGWSVLCIASTNTVVSEIKKHCSFQHISFTTIHHSISSGKRLGSSASVCLIDLTRLYCHLFQPFKLTTIVCPTTVNLSCLPRKWWRVFLIWNPFRLTYLLVFHKSAQSWNKENYQFSTTQSKVAKLSFYRRLQNFLASAASVHTHFIQFPLLISWSQPPKPILTIPSSFLKPSKPPVQLHYHHVEHPAAEPNIVPTDTKSQYSNSRYQSWFACPICIDKSLIRVRGLSFPWVSECSLEVSILSIFSMNSFSFPTEISPVSGVAYEKIPNKVKTISLL